MNMDPARRPLVLLSNDDGYNAPGLRILREALLEVADVVVCAPDTEQSATSHSLTLSRPLRLKKHGEGICSLDGTPADCVYVALHSGGRVLPRRPDLVVSGMNHGANLGTDVFYSGTVAAAREGALRGYRALAVSNARDGDFHAASAVAARLALAVIEEAAPILVNVNFPPGSSWPLRQTRLGSRVYTDTVDYRRDPRGVEYLWLGGPGAEHALVEGSDTEAYDAGAIGVTPLLLDLFASGDIPAACRIVERTG
ncbi:MAG TPA: 5'/3'-nucleotidase SurE [Polyangiaceae bacterium]|jgi:5'-nucleotidase|nr:5'/3'-nucleotidase SurE [Polyangiaceae bacterium]